ncbi:MAG: tetratricopeptide repeat protein [Planctomycetota bacterium]|nr:tetratricopeptide repeat protein [Planctomycetota bacterium]
MRSVLALLPLLLPACGGASAPPVTVAELLPAGVQEVDPAVLEVLEQRVGAVNRDLGSAAVRRSLALALEANSFWAEAIAQYRLALGMDAADWDALLHLAGCLRQAGDLSGELDALERVVAARPDDRAALNRLAVARLDQGNLDGARELFRTLRSLLPEHPHGPLGLGQVELEAGNAEVALEHLESARALGRGAPFIDFVLGQCLAELGRTDEAVVLLDRGADSNRPQIATALEDEKARYSVSRADRISRAGRLHEAGRSAEARLILERLREQDPDDVPVLNNLAAAQMKLGRQDEAIATLEHVLELEPDQYAAWFNLASIHFDRGQEQMSASGSVDADLVALAMQAADRAVEFGGHLANMHLMRAKVLMLARSYAEAVTEFQASIRLGTTNEDVYLNCSKVQMNLGDQAGGIQTLMDGAARNPSWAEVRIQLLPYWVARRDGLAARGVLAEIEALIPEDPRLPKLRDYLKSNGL